MKARSQRTHLMGKSNRQNYDVLQKSKSILQRSFNKSQILQKTSKLNPQTSSKLNPSTPKQLNPQRSSKYNVSIFQKTQKLKSSRINPFNGTNFQLQSSRFDKMNIKPYRYKQNQKTRQIVPMKDYSNKVNQKIKQIKKQYEGKNINTHKLYYLKQTILQNNRDRVNFQQYFNSFRHKDQKIINQKGLKQFIKSFGYDLNNQQISMFLKLNLKSNHQSNSSNKQPQIDIKNFIQICTKQNIYFKTINLNQNNQHKISHKTFKPNHFQILRNKFNKLKQAFKIYRTRNQPINYQKFVYTMKKLDINDLIMPKPQRDQLFLRFIDQQGNFNSQGLLSSIAAHYHQQKQQIKQKTGFQDNLKYMEEQQAQKNKTKQSKYNLKKSSFIQYERHLTNARVILNQLKKMSSKQITKQEILNQINQKDIINKNQLKKDIQNFLMKKGFSYKPQKYESLLGYFDFDSSGNITKKQLQKFIFIETDKQAQARIQRQTRNLPPITPSKQSINLNSTINLDNASKVLLQLKRNTLNPQVSELFKSFDDDKDGYISRKQFKNRVKQTLVRQSDQKIQDLTSLFFEDKNYLTRDQFVKRYQFDQFFSIQKSKAKSKSIWQYNDLRKSAIHQLKKSYFFRPTKYSAWPEHLFQHNLSLIQAPQNSAVHMPERQRFNNYEKHYYGLEEKLERHKRRNMKIAKMSALNKQKQQQ